MSITKEDRYAYVEVLEIIKYLNANERKRIPNQIIDSYEKFKDKDYKFKYNRDIELREQISARTKVIVANLFVKYIASEKDRNDIYMAEKRQYIREEMQRREKVKIKPLFEDNKKQNYERGDNLPVKVEEKSFFSKLVCRIRNLLKR